MNKDLYNKKYFKASLGFQANPKRIAKFVELINSYNPTNVLDVGCGIGSLVRSLDNATGVDFSPDLREQFWGNDPRFIEAEATRLPFQDNSVDLVFSSDFFEHIPEEDIDKVASEMIRVGGKVITFVADDIGENLSYRQRLYHITHKPLSWWKDRLQGIEVYSSHIL